jgi:DNA integrity scanning protein DisA with diadenylate cyclase activity
VTKEEGSKPTGYVGFLPQEKLDRLIENGGYTLISNSPHDLKIELAHTKHVRKLLPFTSYDCYLLSDGAYIRAFGKKPDDEALLLAKFESGLGELFFEGHLICTFIDGQFHGVKHKVDLSKFEDILQKLADNKTETDKLLSVVQNTVDHAHSQRHGCTIIVDLRDKYITLPGEKISPASDDIGLIQRMSSIDGALHINRAGQLVSFSVLLDGSWSNDEDRSRGSRYNSAVRFIQKEGNGRVIIIVVSEDGPVTVVAKDAMPIPQQHKRIDLHPCELNRWFDIQQTERENRELAAKAPIQ